MSCRNYNTKKTDVVLFEILILDKKINFLLESHLILWEDQIRQILNSYFPKDITGIILKLYMKDYKYTYAHNILKDIPEEYKEMLKIIK